MKKILFINQATGYLTIDIINEFAREYDELVLITGSIRIQDVQLNPKVKVSYIIKYNRGGILRKFISWLIGTLMIFLLLKFRYNKFERFYFTIPPLAYLQALHFKSPFSIVIYDLYPDVLKIRGYSHRSFLFQWWSRKNNKIFSAAHKIYTLSNTMKTKILEYANNADVHVIPNWSAFNELERIPKSENKLISENNYDNKFIIQYSGNIGITHNVEVLVEIAELMKTDEDLLFLIIGRGKRVDVIKKMINKKGLNNCKILPFRKDEELFDSLCAADIAVITLDDNTPDVSVPSKTYNLMAAGTPLMVIADKNSGLASMVLKYQNGKVFDKNDRQAMSAFINELKNNSMLWKEMSENSLQASQNYTRLNAKEYLNIYSESTVK